jgi:hypothetical protein
VCLFVILECFEKPEGIDIGKVGVQEYEIGFGPGYVFWGAWIAGYPGDGVTILFQQLLQQVDAGCVIIDDRD